MNDYVFKYINDRYKIYLNDRGILMVEYSRDSLQTIQSIDSFYAETQNIFGSYTIYDTLKKWVEKETRPIFGEVNEFINKHRLILKERHWGVINKETNLESTYDDFYATVIENFGNKPVFKNILEEWFYDNTEKYLKFNHLFS